MGRTQNRAAQTAQFGIATAETSACVEALTVIGGGAPSVRVEHPPSSCSRAGVDAGDPFDVHDDGTMSATVDGETLAPLVAEGGATRLPAGSSIRSPLSG